jgi:hypothetical protein
VFGDIRTEHRGGTGDTVRAIAEFILADDRNRLRPSDFTSGVRKVRYDSQKEIAEWASRFCAMGAVGLQPTFQTSHHNNMKPTRRRVQDHLGGYHAR